MKVNRNTIKSLEKRITILEEQLRLVNAKANHIKWGWSEEIICEECGTIQLDTRSDCSICGPYITCKKCKKATYHFRKWNLDNDFLDREYNTILKYYKKQKDQK